MSSRLLDKQTTDQEVGKGDEEGSLVSPRTSHQVEIDREADHAGPEETSDREQVQGEDGRSENWSRSKRGDPEELISHANKSQVPNLTRRFGTVMKKYQQLSMRLWTRLGETSLI